MLFLTSSVGVGLDLLGLGVVNTVNGVDGALVVGGGVGLGLACVGFFLFSLPKNKKFLFLRLFVFDLKFSSGLLLTLLLGEKENTWV